ncbi:MAG TPA: hypothetical protein VL588_06945 [Bdellovibrionota bacterium]|jgi:hypothetical protein|nr:hypothetical protein [Bdellovibrionota bacterium]
MKDMEVMEETTGQPEGRDANGGMKVDGFKQVLEMLQIADPQFRESLLKRLASRDPRLAQSLRLALTSH